MARMMKKNIKTSLGIYNAPQRFDVDPMEGQGRRKKRTMQEAAYESETPQNIDAGTYQEMKKRTKRGARGNMGIYS